MRKWWVVFITLLIFLSFAVEPAYAGWGSWWYHTPYQTPPYQTPVYLSPTPVPPFANISCKWCNGGCGPVDDRVQCNTTPAGPGLLCKETYRSTSGINCSVVSSASTSTPIPAPCSQCGYSASPNNTCATTSCTEPGKTCINFKTSCGNNPNCYAIATCPVTPTPTKVPTPSPTPTKIPTPTPVRRDCRSCSLSDTPQGVCSQALCTAERGLLCTTKTKSCGDNPNCYFVLSCQRKATLTPTRIPTPTQKPWGFNFFNFKSFNLPFLKPAPTLTPKPLGGSVDDQNPGPGGCTSDQTCQSYCDDPNNKEECSKYHWSGPGGCTDQASCSSYCQKNYQDPDCSKYGGGQGAGDYGNYKEQLQQYEQQKQQNLQQFQQMEGQKQGKQQEYDAAQQQYNAKQQEYNQMQNSGEYQQKMQQYNQMQGQYQQKQQEYNQMQNSGQYQQKLQEYQQMQGQYQQQSPPSGVQGANTSQGLLQIILERLGIHL